MSYPAYCDVTGYLHGRAGGWPHLFPDERSVHKTPEKIATTAYYDVVNLARRLEVPGIHAWGYNDHVCPPTSTYAAYNGVTAPKTSILDPAAAHELTAAQATVIDDWLVASLGAARR